MGGTTASEPSLDPSPSRLRVSPLFAATLILLAGLAMSGIASWRTAVEADIQIEARFRSLSDRSFGELDRRLDEFRDLALTMQASYDAVGDLDRFAFKRYSDRLILSLQMPGLQALSFQRHVRCEHRAAFVARVRNDRSIDPRGYPAFDIQPPGERAEYVVIEYIEPGAANRSAMGVDAYAQPDNREAIDRARDSGAPAASRPFTIAQNPAGTPRIVLRAPIYGGETASIDAEQRRARIRGYVVLTIDIQAALADAFGELNGDDQRIQVLDSGAIRDGRTDRSTAIFDSGDFRPQAASALSSGRDIEFGGRRWDLHYSASEDWRTRQPEYRHTLWVFAAGAVASALLAVLVWSLVRSRNRALALATAMTDALRKKSKVLEATLDAMDQGISVVDASLRMQAMNRRFYEIFTIGANEMPEGAHFADFVRFNAQRGEYGVCDVDACVASTVDMVRRFEPHQIRRVRPNGRIVDIRGRPLPAGGFVTTYTDITEQESAARAIQELNESLERRVRERTAELLASNQELEAFSYSVSHDLRAPLRALHGYSLLLEEEYGERLDAQGMQYLERIRKASERMGKLIDDLLDMARINRQELVRRDVDLSAAAQRIRASLEEQFPEREVKWMIAENLRARADPLLMNVLLDNLLRNAWKFTSEKPVASIEFGADEVDGRRELFVKDNGAGFDMRYADKLFKPFERLHHGQRFEGTGIGLAIVHRIVVRHGGDIRAEGAPEQGACIRFTLP